MRIGGGSILAETLESEQGIQNLWANLEYLGENSDKQHLWGLKDFGINDAAVVRFDGLYQSEKKEIPGDILGFMRVVSF